MLVSSCEVGYASSRASGHTGSDPAPGHRWVWSDPDRRVRKLLIFGEVETDGGRDILRASEVTPDPLLRRLYLEHAIDELHHGVLFKERGEAFCGSDPRGRTRCSAGIRCRADTGWTTSASRTRRSETARLPAHRGEDRGWPLRDLQGLR